MTSDLKYPHPLDPLTPAEIASTARIIKESFKDQSFIFNSITLLEPQKALLLSFQPKPNQEDQGQIVSNQQEWRKKIPRKSFSILISKESGEVTEVTVNLTSVTIEASSKAPPGSQPTLSPEDCFDAERITKSDPGVQAKCAQLGYSNMDLVVADPWSFGYVLDRPDLVGKRLVQCFMYVREFENDNHYAHPLDFVTVVNLLTEKVEAIELLPISKSDFSILRKSNDLTIPKTPANYDNELLCSEYFRKDLKPLEILSPQGPSFKVEGHEIEWQKFKFRISFNYREGLVLHNVRYQDGGQTRDILYRASLVEMVVPYSDPRPPFHRKCAFDVGDYGLGFCTNSLELGCDCLGTIKYFDGVYNNHAGEPVIIKNAICLHEEDAGILFKHTEFRNGRVTVTRARKLVLSFIVTVVNYEYTFYWTFHQDGSIAFEVKATGELSTNLRVSEDNHDTEKCHDEYGTLVFPEISAGFHQHIFAMRLDTMIDGLQNSVSSLDVVQVDSKPGSPGNPYGQGFQVIEKPLRTIGEAITNSSLLTSRIWKIWNPNSIHPITHKPVGWKLISTSGVSLLADPSSIIGRRAGFATASVWVTPFSDHQTFPAGFYVNQNSGGDGLPQWTKDGSKAVENEDIVIWHVFGLTHVPRVEDFPIMSSESCGFTLKPLNFFKGNPGLDVPSSKPKSRTRMKNTECCVSGGSES